MYSLELIHTQTHSILFTYCKEQYQVSKYFLMAHESWIFPHILSDPISVCNHAISEKQTYLKKVIMITFTLMQRMNSFFFS